MELAPTIYRLVEIENAIRTGPKCSVDGKTWVPARPLGLATLGQRIKAARLVFIGLADAVIWPEDER